MAVSVGLQEVIDDFIRPVLGDLNNIQVNGELGVPSRDRKTIQFDYFPMVVERSIRPRFEFNRQDSFLIEDTDYTIDLDLGETVLKAAGPSQFEPTGGILSIGDEIKGFYRFEYFTDDELASYINLSLFELNARKPATAFVIENAPLEWNAGFMVYTYIRCLNRILSDTTMWRGSIIFADPEAVRSQFNSKLQMANQQWDFLSKILNRRGFARPKAVVSRRLAVQQRVTEVNFRDFTINI